MTPRVEWVGEEKIEEILNVSTGACSYCGGPARVPEDVAAVYQDGAQVIPVIVCPACSPTFEADLRRRLDSNQPRREEKQNGDR